MKWTFAAQSLSALWTLACGTLAGGTAVVTYLSVTVVADIAEVTVVTTMADVLYYCWYVDGEYVGQTTGPTRSFRVTGDEQLRVDVIPTDDPDFDPVANAPEGYPSRRKLWWIRSRGTTIDHYRVEQREGSGDWSTIATIPHDDGSWEYSAMTDRLDDLADYTWRIIPVDSAGNDGSPISLGPETVVRHPDAPQFTTAFSEADRTIEFDLTATT